jgi:hypothetical protein
MGVYDYWGENHLVVEETTNTSNIQDDNSRPLTTWLAVSSLEKKLSKGTYLHYFVYDAEKSYKYKAMLRVKI